MNSIEKAIDCCDYTGKAIIIKGKTKCGQPFRPSDWPERLSGSFSTIGSDNRVIYSSFVRPVMHMDTKSVLVSMNLRHENNAAFKLLMDFIKIHNLVVEQPD